MGEKVVQILVVEDEEDHAELVRRAFESHAARFHLTVAASLQEARECLAQRRPDLVIADLVLPDGHCTELLLSEEDALRFPFVIMTAQGDEEAAVGAMKAGALDYVVKSESTLADMPRVAERALREWDHIIARKRLAEELRKREEQYRTLVANIPDVVWTSDARGCTSFISPNVADVYGYTPLETYQAGDHRWFGRIHPDDAARVKEAFRALVTGRQPYDVEYRIQRKDGQWIWLHDRAMGSYDHASVVRVDGVFSDITDRKRTEEAVRRSRQELRALAGHLRTVREEERARLARRVHDELGHALVALKMDLAWVISKGIAQAEAALPRELAERTAAMSEALDDTIESIRETASELRPGLLDDAGLEAAIEWEARQFEASTGVECSLECSPAHVKLDREQSINVFRICEELLTNVARHAKASAVRVALKEDADELILEVSDNGRGITEEEASSSESLGLLGIRERVLLLAGEFSIAGVPGRGTTATVKIPLGKSEGKPDSSNPRAYSDGGC